MWHGAYPSLTHHMNSPFLQEICNKLCLEHTYASFNHGMALPEGWPLKASALKGDHMYYGFTVLSLLEDYCSNKNVLVVPHTGDQAD